MNTSKKFFIGSANMWIKITSRDGVIFSYNREYKLKIKGVYSPRKLINHEYRTLPENNRAKQALLLFIKGKRFNNQLFKYIMSITAHENKKVKERVLSSIKEDLLSMLK